MEASSKVTVQKKKYWYYTEIEYCVLCGHENKYRERRYTPKPENPSERTVVRETACGHHFM